jgi:hypothetical protein
MIIQIITFKRRPMPLDLPQPDLSEGPWQAMCVSPLPYVGLDRIKREEVTACGETREEAVINLTSYIKDLMLKNPYIEQVETSAIQI